MRRVYCEAINDLRGTAAPTRKDPTMELLRAHEPLEAFVFDMDGTLLDSLPDLVDVTNETGSRTSATPRTPPRKSWP